MCGFRTHIDIIITNSGLCLSNGRRNVFISVRKWARGELGMFRCFPGAVHRNVPVVIDDVDVDGFGRVCFSGLASFGYPYQRRICHRYNES